MSPMTLRRAFHCIPVARPQDMAYKGQGTITLEEGSAKVLLVRTAAGCGVGGGKRAGSSCLDPSH